MPSPIYSEKFLHFDKFKDTLDLGWTSIVGIKNIISFFFPNLISIFDIISTVQIFQVNYLAVVHTKWYEISGDALHNNQSGCNHNWYKKK